MRHNENEALKLNLENTRGEQGIFWVCCTLQCGHGYIMLTLWLNCILALNFSFNVNHTVYFDCISFLISLCIFPSIQRKAIYFQLVLDVCQVRFSSQLNNSQKIFLKIVKGIRLNCCCCFLVSCLLNLSILLLQTNYQWATSLSLRCLLFFIFFSQSRKSLCPLLYWILEVPQQLKW